MSRRLAAGALAFVLLTAAAGVLRRRARPPAERAALGSISAGAIVRLETRGPAGEVSLFKKGGVWRLGGPAGPPADAQASRLLAEQAAGVRLGSEVSQDPQSYGSYGLLEPDAVRLRVFSEADAAPALDGYFGARAFGGETLYFRRSGQTPVWLASGMAADVLGAPPERYRFKP